MVLLELNSRSGEWLWRPRDVGSRPPKMTARL